MRVVIQRVSRAEVRCGERRAAIVVASVLGTRAQLRAFEDEAGKLNLGLAEVGGEILAVSQFTLAGSLERGRRPSFDRAMAPEPARALFEVFLAQLRSHHDRVATGFFQEHMAVELVNDGPVTFVLERTSG